MDVVRPSAWVYRSSSLPSARWPSHRCPSCGPRAPCRSEHHSETRIIWDHDRRRPLDGGGGATEDLEDEAEDVKEAVERTRPTPSTIPSAMRPSDERISDSTSRMIWLGEHRWPATREFLLSLTEHEQGNTRRRQLPQRWRQRARKPNRSKISPPLRSTSLCVLAQSSSFKSQRKSSSPRRVLRPQHRWRRQSGRCLIVSKVRDTGYRRSRR